MLLYGWTFCILYLYIINGRLEAEVYKSVDLIVCFSSLPTSIGASGQDFPQSTGGGGLEERNFHRAHKSDNIGI